MRVIIKGRSFFASQIIAAFLMILSVAFLSGCGDDEEDEFVNPQSTVIGSQGGTALSTDGNVAVEIPAGAVSSDTTIVVGEASSIPAGTIGKAYQFGPKDFKFDKPVTISLKYAADDVPAGANDYDLALGRESGDQWEEVSGSSVDMVDHAVSGSVTGFSSYGIFWPGAPSTSAEYWNLVNDQVCKVLDATREMNTGMLMVYRGAEGDFTHEFDPAKIDYSVQEIDWIMAGFVRIGESITPLEDAMRELEELEAAAMGNAAPSRIAREHHSKGLGDFADSVNAIAFPLLKKAAAFVGIESPVPFTGTVDNISYKLKVKMLAYVGLVIDEMSIGLSTQRHCDRACRLNKLFKREYGRYFYEPPTPEICKQDKAKIRAEAFNILNQRMDSATSFKKLSNLSRAMADEFPEWLEELRAFVPGAAADATIAGGEFYWDCIKKIVIQGDIADKIDHLELVSKAFDKLPPLQAPGKSAAMAPGNGIYPAHAVVFLVPHDMENLPILVSAAVAEGDTMRIPEPYVGTYKLHFYSKGNYPIILDDVEISSTTSSINMPDPQPLEVKVPRFSALTTGDPRVGLDPPPVPPCPTCSGGSYRVVHEARCYGQRQNNEPGQGGIGNPGTIDFRTRTEFTFDFEENGEAVVDVPYIVNKVFTSKPDDAGFFLTYTPSSFSLHAIVRWRILKETRGDEICYIATFSGAGPIMVEEELQENIVVRLNVPEKGVLVLDDNLINAPFEGFHIFDSTIEIGCGDLPLTYDDQYIYGEDTSFETTYDVTITIEKIQ